MVFLFILFANYVQILSDFFFTFENDIFTHSQDNVPTTVESLIHIIFDTNIQKRDNLISELVRLSFKNMLEYTIYKFHCY